MQIPSAFIPSWCWGGAPAPAPWCSSSFLTSQASAHWHAKRVLSPLAHPDEELQPQLLAANARKSTGSVTKGKPREQTWCLQAPLVPRRGAICFEDAPVRVWAEGSCWGTRSQPAAEQQRRGHGGTLVASSKPYAFPSIFPAVFCPLVPWESSSRWSQNTAKSM